MESGHIVLLVWGNINTRPASVYLILSAVNSSRGHKEQNVPSISDDSFRAFRANGTDIPGLWMPREHS